MGLLDRMLAPAKGGAPRRQSLLDVPLYHFGNDPQSVGQACQGTAIFGMTGSCKTTASGALLAKSFLSAGMGGLWFCAKPGERQLLERYCRDTGRSKSLIVISPSHPYRFDVMSFEYGRPGAGAGLTQNIVGRLMTLMEMAERRQGNGQGPDYWMRTSKEVCSNAVEVLATGTGQVSLASLMEVILSAPNSEAELRSAAFQDRSLLFRCVMQGENRRKSAQQAHDFERAARFFFSQWPNLAEKTRSVILSCVSSIADALLRGPIREIFCSGVSNIVPELSERGAIFCVDLSAKEYGEAGIFAAQMFAASWMAAMERRNVERSPLPVFMWCDEAQVYVVSNWTNFAATARSSRVAIVLLSQNLPIYYSALGGERSRADVDSLLGNLATKIFHCNGCPTTNSWASESIGKRMVTRASAGISTPQAGLFDFGNQGPGHVSSNTSTQLEAEVLPVRFTTLRTGGRMNKFVADAIVFQAGRRFSNGKTWLDVAFKQDI